MHLSRIATTFVCAAILLPASLPAQEGKQGATDVTPEQLFKNPEKYHGKLVRFEGVVELTPTARDRNQREPTGQVCYDLSLGGKVDVYILCAGKPSVVKGDRVRVTGTFTSHPNTFVRRRLAVDPPHGKVEKLEERK